MTDFVWIAEARHGEVKLSKVEAEKRTLKTVKVGKEKENVLGGYHYIRRVYPRYMVHDTEAAALAALHDDLGHQIGNAESELQKLRSALGTVAARLRRVPSEPAVHD